jgi:Na+/proline symporter
MSQSTVILGLSVAYLGLLFVVAYVGERRAASWSQGKLAPVIYALSLAIYCTSWTFYGAVGRAATVGLDFMLIYVGRPWSCWSAGRPWPRSSASPSGTTSPRSQTSWRRVTARAAPWRWP